MVKVNEFLIIAVTLIANCIVSYKLTFRKLHRSFAIDDHKFDTPKSDHQRIKRRLPLLPYLTIPFGYASICVAADSIRFETKASPRPLVYSVEMVDPPSLLPRTAIGEENVAKRLYEQDVVLLGEHIESFLDKNLESDIINRMIKNKASKRMMKIGLDAFEESSQIYFDEYINNYSINTEKADQSLLENLSLNGLNSKTNVSSYLPIFQLARSNGIQLKALGITEKIKQKVIENGLAGLTDKEKSMYILDSQGFIDFVRIPGFKQYTDRIIVPEYDEFVKRISSSKTVTPETYFASRIFEDEALACKIAIDADNNSTLVVILSNQKVKFGYGVQERIARNLQLKYNQTAGGIKAQVLSVLLNPTALDSNSPIAQLQLCLGYGPFLPDQRPLSNYLWFSSYPPVKILTRPKNSISAEGEKPPGEASIIGAF